MLRFRLKHLLFAAAALLLTLTALAQANAPPQASSLRGLHYPAERLMDPTGQQSLADVQRRFENGEGEPVSGSPPLQLGGEHTAWLRIPLPAQSLAGELVLTVAHPGMDSVVLHHPVPGGQWQRQTSGDQLPVAQWPLPTLQPAFSLQLSAGDPRPVYLAVRHSNPIGVYWQLWDRASFDRQNSAAHLVLGAYLGAVLLVVILSLFNACNWRDPIHLLYAVYVLVLGAGQLSLTGVAGAYLWPHSAWWNDIAPVVLPVFSGAWAALLVQRLVGERGHRRVNTLLLSVIVLTAVLTLLLSLPVLGAWRETLFFLSNLAYLYIMVVVLGSLVGYSFRRPVVGLWALAGFSCLAIGSLFPILRNFNLLPVNFYTQFGAQIGAALEIPMLLVALYFSSRERRDNQVRLDALSRVDPLTGVASHRLLMERLEHLLQRRQRDPKLGAVLRVRLANQPQLRATYGPLLAQAALVRAGACVALPAQPSDTVGRHSDGDFVLLMEGRADELVVNEVAQHIIAAGLRPSRKFPPELLLHFQVACADASQLDAAGDGGLALLLRLEEVLDEIAENPRKPLRFLRKRRLDGGPASA